MNIRFALEHADSPGFYLGATGDLSKPVPLTKALTYATYQEALHMAKTYAKECNIPCHPMAYDVNALTEA